MTAGRNGLPLQTGLLQTRKEVVQRHKARMLDVNE